MPNTVIVIDPGHGGENEGALWNDYVEKEINMRVALSMKKELEKYDDVTVYLTHTEDVDMSLEERAEFAKSVNADFLACLHFNMSEYHTLYGTECWVSAFGECHAKSYDFAKIANELLAAEGIHNRGVKTRLGSKDKTKDYYGILRHSTARGIPATIIEHCHLDRVEDEPYVNHDTWLDRYGVIDATAIAKYFHLKSEELGVDYSDYYYEKTATPKSVVAPDGTEPEECEIINANYDSDKDVIKVEVTAKESDSFLCYYTYSLDGGETFSELQSWDYGANHMTIEIPMPSRNIGDLIVRAHNNHDLIKASEPLRISNVFVQRQQFLKEQFEKAERIRLEEYKKEQELQSTLIFIEEVPASSKPKLSQETMVYGSLVVILGFVLCELMYIRRKIKRARASVGGKR